MQKIYQQTLRSLPLFFWPILFWALIAAITYLMLMPLTQKTGGFEYWDKIQHALIFTLPTIIGIKAFSRKKWWVIGGLITFGGVMEIMQSLLTTTRQASAYDWLADIVGIAIVVGINFLLIKKS
jgi:VanZ family protein